MNEPTTKILVQQKNTTLILTLNIPEKRNALAADVRTELCELLKQAELNNSIKVIIITGTDGIFCSGGDLSAMNVQTLAEGRHRMKVTGELIKQLAKMNKPVIAAVEGWAVGAGLSLALACDTIIASNKTRFAAGFGKVGLIPDLGLLYHLPRRVGPAKAKQILFYGETINAQDAEKMGLVDFLCAEGETLELALEKANILITQAPIPQAMMKIIFSEGLERLLDQEMELQAQLFLTADHAEGKKAFFEKCAPIFKGL